MNRRNFLSSMGAILAAPAIVKAENIMPVKVVREPLRWLKDLERSITLDSDLEYWKAILGQNPNRFTKVVGVTWHELKEPEGTLGLVLDTKEPFSKEDMKRAMKHEYLHACDLSRFVTEDMVMYGQTLSALKECENTIGFKRVPLAKIYSL